MYHDHWSTADGWDEVPKVQSFGWRQAHEKVVCTVQHNKQPWEGGACGWQLTGTAMIVCCESRGRE